MSPRQAPTSPKRPRRKPAGARAQRRAASPRRQRGSWLRRHWLGVTFSLLVLLGAVGVVGWLGMAGYSGDSTWIYIPRGATEASVKDTLKVHLGSAMGCRVHLLWQLQGGTPSVAHGAYRADHGRSALSLSRAMAKGRQTPVRVSFTGVRTMADLARRIATPLELTPEEFDSACVRVLPAYGYKAREQYPAAFLPDTYEYYWTVSPDTLVARLARATAAFWTDERLEAARAEGLDPVGVATVASIVEEETAKADERPVVARLYLNRLGTGMKLQADPTVKFAVGDPTLRRINLNHLRTPSPYNTYLHAGLPPGPIRVVEKATLEAVLQAPAHDYIYMCAKEDFSGYHRFSASYADHLRNAAAYQAELNRRNIR